MWAVDLQKNLKKQLRKLPKQAVNALTVRINAVQIEGPMGQKFTRDFDDEALQG